MAYAVFRICCHRAIFGVLTRPGNCVRLLNFELVTPAYGTDKILRGDFVKCCCLRLPNY